MIENGTSGKASLKTLAALAIVILAVAVALHWNQGRQGSGKYEREKLFGSLKLGEVDRVKIVTEENTIALKKVSDEKWVMENRGGYPIERQRLAKLVIALADLEPIDRMTDNPEKYEKMGVTDEKPEMGRVEVLDKDQKVLAGLRLGKQRTPPSEEEGFVPPDGQFVRADGDKAVYLLKDELTLDTLPATWLEKEILTSKDEEIQKVRVEHASTTESFTLERTGGEPFKITSAIPDGWKEKAPSVQSASKAINSLTLTDILAAGDPKVGEVKFDSKYAATFKNGLVIELSGGKLDSETYIKLAASHDPASDFSTRDERTSDTVLAKAMEKADVAVKNLNDRHQPWVYKLQSYQYDNIMKKLSDLIEQAKIPEAGAAGPPIPLAPPAEPAAAPEPAPAPAEASPADAAPPAGDGAPVPAEPAPSEHAPAEPSPAEPAPQ